ncbi:hypothetical protein GALL_434090 [mine drainage metagenome]|uniref:Uncharacterized protein n=1 Tax=mine drainage metagenome TaxID=410659 RepID=A0A1J5PVP1_9ZZZZ
MRAVGARGLGDVALRAGQCGQRRVLRRGVDARDDRLLHRGHHRERGPRHDECADAHPGHRVRLGERVQREHAAVGVEARGRDVRDVVGERLVALVGEHPEVVAPREVDQALEQLRRHRGAQRVGG